MAALGGDMGKNEYGLQERPKRNNRGLLTVLLLIGLAVLAVAAMWAATQKAAADCGFQSGRGIWDALVCALVNL